MNCLESQKNQQKEGQESPKQNTNNNKKIQKVPKLKHFEASLNCKFTSKYTKEKLTRKKDDCTTAFTNRAMNRMVSHY